MKKITPAGKLTTLAGTGRPGYSGDGGPARKAELFDPAGVAVDGKGNVYVADYDNQRVRKISAKGIITTVAGTGKAGFSGDGGPARKAQLNLPADVAVDDHGNLYIADFRNFRVRKVTPAGIITTIAGNGAFGNADGQATKVPLESPFGVAVDRRGIVYVTVGQSVRAITGSKSTRIAGSLAYHNPFVVGDGGAALLSDLQTPAGIAVSPTGTVYFAELSANRVRRLTK